MGLVVPYKSQVDGGAVLVVLLHYDLPVKDLSPLAKHVEVKLGEH